MSDLAQDFERLLPYLSDFAEAALMEGEDTALLCAVCIRETWAGWAPGYVPAGSPTGRGDHGHGFGLFQIDDRGPYAYLPKEAPTATAHLQARWACWVLRDMRNELSRFKRHPLYERAVVCAYNAGSPRVSRALEIGVDPDLCTTGGDYGTDVIATRQMLRAAYPERFPLPNSQKEAVA